MRALAAVAILLAWNASIAGTQDYWAEQRDDLAEYLLDSSANNVRSDSECVAIAGPQHQAVQFASELRTCRMFSCLLGRSGCRKCRNARNSSLPLLLVRRLDELGRTCWRTFQHRVDGSVDFYRNWTDYLAEFGQGEDRNYWMGLEAIHQLTQVGDRRVRWEMSDWNDTRYWWEDTYFSVAGAAQGYRVSVGPQDNSSSNVLACNSGIGAFMNGMMFSTPDRDQDGAPSSACAVAFHGAWWYNGCYCFNPNGRYSTPPTALSLPQYADGLTFQGPTLQYPLTHYYSMKTFECLVTSVL